MPDASKMQPNFASKPSTHKKNAMLSGFGMLGLGLQVLELGLQVLGLWAEW